ncbi:Comt, partial [Symbiodinium sp. KB8]
VEVEIRVAPSCVNEGREAESDFLSLRLIEASVDWQETLIEEACSEEDETCVEADPYGMAVWPAAQVLAQAAAAYGLRAQGALELGCGCGLASLALLSLDMEESAERLGVAERLETQLLDLRDHGQPLPKADLVLASDVLYEKQTAEAMAQRVVEARQQNCAVLISDIGRPNRKVFIEKLAGLRPEESSEFASSGTAVQRVGGTEAGRTKVELLELPANGPASVLVIPSEGQAMPGFVRVANMIAPKLRDCTADAEDLAIMALAEADQRQLALALCPRLTQGPGTTAEEFLEMLQCRADTNLFRKVLPELNFAMKDEVWDVRRSAVHLLSELGPFFVDITTETLKQLHPCRDEVVQLMVAFVLKNVEGDAYRASRASAIFELRPTAKKDVCQYEELQRHEDHGSVVLLGVNVIGISQIQMQNAMPGAREKKLLHCDLKPHDILLGADGQLKIAGFVLRLIPVDMLLGTPSYSNWLAWCACCHVAIVVMVPVSVVVVLAVVVLMDFVFDFIMVVVLVVVVLVVLVFLMAVVVLVLVVAGAAVHHLLHPNDHAASLGNAGGSPQQGAGNEIVDSDRLADHVSELWPREAELSILRRALRVEPNSPDAVLEANLGMGMHASAGGAAQKAMSDFGQELGEAGAWAKFAGGSKAQSLLAALGGAAPTGRGPPEVLEIGTYCSYSAISIVTGSSAQVTSIEIDPILVAIARGIITHAGLSSRVRVWTGHSRLLLPLLMQRRQQERPAAPWFDAMFIDRWGTQYPEDLDFVEKLGLLRPSGALLVADNVLRTAAAHFLWRLTTDKVQQPSGKLQRIFASRTVEVNEVGDASDVDWMSVSVTLRGIPDEQALVREQVPDELEELQRVSELMRLRTTKAGSFVSLAEIQTEIPQLLAGQCFFVFLLTLTLWDRRRLCLNLLGLDLHDDRCVEEQEVSIGDIAS